MVLLFFATTPDHGVYPHPHLPAQLLSKVTLSYILTTRHCHLFNTLSVVCPWLLCCSYAAVSHETPKPIASPSLIVDIVLSIWRYVSVLLDHNNS